MTSDHSSGGRPPAGVPDTSRGSGVSKDAGDGVNRGWGEMDSLAEDDLVELARSDREAFGILYDRYFDAVYHYIARRVGSPRVAEDIAGAVWERALTAIDRYEVRGVPFAAWLYRIAGNLVANHHRRQRLRRRVQFDRHHDVSPESKIDDRRMLYEAMDKLSDSDREVVSLYYFAGMKPAEICQVLDCSVAAVHKRLHRARERLRHHIEGD
jgi:RNA polymerase sigma-70 factor (ECF subfamily)